MFLNVPRSHREELPVAWSPILPELKDQMDPLPPPEVWTPLLQFLQGPAPEAGGVASAPEAGGVASPLVGW